MLVYTTVSPEYCPNWGIKEALRELFQEALDVRRLYGCNSEVRYDGSTGRVVIQDDGPGIELSSFVLGKSNKRDNDQAIGQFGEGMKLGCLILVRNGREVIIETKGYTLRPVIAENPDFGCEVLAFEIEENTRTVGTVFYVEATREEYEQASNLFLEFGAKDMFYVPTENGPRPIDPERDNIFLPGGYLFVQGVAVAMPRNEPLLFSYNIPTKCIQGRDRFAIDVDTLRNEVIKLWTNCTEISLIERLLEAIKRDETYLEVVFGLVPDPSYDLILNPAVWGRAVSKVFAKSVVSETKLYPYQLQRCEELGYEVVIPHYRVRYLLEHFGVPRIDKISGAMKPDLVPVKTLSPIEKYNFQHAVKLFKRSLDVPADIKFAVADFQGAPVSGRYHDGVIYVSREILENMRELMATLVHEYAHHISDGADDYTSRFEKALETVAVDAILLRSMSRSKKSGEFVA